MPYQTTNELPANIKSKYSDHAQRVYMEVFNQVLKDTGDEARAFAAAAAAANKIDVKESEVFVTATFRESAGESASFHIEGAFHEGMTEDNGVTTVPVTIIKPGMSGNKFYYSKDVLKGLVPLLEGAKAYRNHETKSEVKDRGGRSIDDILGWYTDAKQEEDGRVGANLHLVETPYTEHAIKMIRANPSLVGLSINAKGIASRGKVEDKTALIAESFEKLYSTDLVTEAAAGGEVRMVASVVMDIEETETPIQESEETMTDDDRMTAEWLLAEMKESQDEEFRQVAAWLMAERDVAMWLAAEAGETRRAAEAEAHQKVIASKIDEAPEEWRSFLEGKELDEVEKFLEHVKSLPPVEEKPKSEPEEKPKRHFL